MDDSANSTPDPDSTARRRSGRVVKAPAKFAPESEALAATTKRKRGDGDGEEADEEDPESDEDMSDEASADSDDDHPAPRSRKQAQRSRPKKPSAKKPKINGDAQSAIGDAISRIPSRPKKTVHIDAADKGSGLFGKNSRLLHAVACMMLIVWQPRSLVLETLPSLSPNNGWKSTRRTTRVPSPI